MSKSKPRRLAHKAEAILEGSGRDLQVAASRFAEDAGEAMSAGAVGLGHAAEALVEEAAARSHKLAKKIRKAIKRRPRAVAVLAGAAVALVGLGLARRTGRA